MTDLARLQSYRNAQRAAVVVTCLTVALVPFGVVYHGWWPQGVLQLAHVVVAGTITMALWRWGARWSAPTSDRMIALLVLPFLVTLWGPPIEDVRAGMLVEPLVMHHFLLIAIAILAPRALAWGLGLIALFTIHALALWMVLEAEGGSPLLAREPWLTLLFALLSAGLCWSAWRRHDVELRISQLATRAESLARINRVLLALRDRANTPIQTLEIGLSSLEDPGPEGNARILALMRRAVANLVSGQQPLVEATRATGEAAVTVDLEGALEDVRRWPPTHRARQARLPRPERATAIRPG